tara:strand:+ start:7918 stop:9186 length:1269 start_codon:yes stop_codon:yes gene_type:complete
MIQRPSQYLIRIAIFLVAVLVLAGFLNAALLNAFMANPALNGLILGVLLIGLGFAIREVLRLTPEVDWLDRVQRGDTRSYGRDPVLLASLSRVVADRPRELRLSPSAMRSLLDGVAARLHESRELSRYGIGLLVFLGLLGTFWGLLTTIGAISNVVNGLTVGPDNIGAVFDDLKSGLQAPLSGMSTAFSSSLFGLAGSLILGFVDLQAGQAQNRFYTDLEDWLSENIDVSSAAGGLVEGDASPNAYLAALVEQNAENLNKLTAVISNVEAERQRNNDALAQLGDHIQALVVQMANEQQVLNKLSDLETGTAPLLNAINQAISEGRLGIDDNSRKHLQNINTNLSRLLEETAQGRVEMLTSVRDEIRLLSKTVAIVAEQVMDPDNQAEAAELRFKSASQQQEPGQPPLPDWLARQQDNSGNKG